MTNLGHLSRLNHYAIIKCACGWEPSDLIENDEACSDLLEHLREHDAD